MRVVELARGRARVREACVTPATSGKRLAARSTLPVRSARRWSLRGVQQRRAGSLECRRAGRRRGSRRLIASQFCPHLRGRASLGRKRLQPVTSSPKTCGCRRTSFSVVPRATAREIARAPFLEQQGQEVDLEQHVAELVAQLLVVAGVRGVRQLVCLLDRVRDDALLVLLPVPGAVPAQAARDRVQLEEGLAQRLGHRLAARGRRRPAGRRRRCWAPGGTPP